MANVLHIIFGVLGNIFGLFLFLSPMITFKRIISKKSTEQFSGLPYVMTSLNCLLATWYSLPFISPNNMLASIISGTGAGLEIIYVIIFLTFAPKKEKAKVFGLFVSSVAFFATIVLFSILALHGYKRRLLCGYAAVIFSIIMYGAPLSVMRMVIKTKSVEFMPFFLSLCVFLCGTSWFIYGVIGKDPFIYVNNGFGCFIGAVQLILYAIYRGKRETNTVVDIDGSSNLKETELDSKQKQVDMV